MVVDDDVLVAQATKNVDSAKTRTNSDNNTFLFINPPSIYQRLKYYRQEKEIHHIYDGKRFKK